MDSDFPSEYCLGIPGLPPLFSCMISGGLYAIQSASPPARVALALQSLGSALGRGRAALITNGAPERLLNRGGEMGVVGLPQALRDKKLQIFRLKESSAKNVFRYGPQRFTQELEYFKVPAEALVVFDGADDLFTLQDAFVVAEQARAYREWIRQRGGCGLMLFSLLSQSSQFAGAYQALLDHLDGALRLESGREQHLTWTVDFWGSPTGMVASRSLGARIEPDGSLSVFEEREAAHKEPEWSPAEAADEDDVFSMDSSLAGIAHQSKGKWTFCDSLVGLLHAARSTTAATIVLVYDRDTEFRQLAQAIHTLRVNLGKRVRIVVRELNASLRYQNELLLIHFGASMIIHREVPVARLLLLLQSLKGQIFNRDIEVDFDAALASVTPSRASGYLQPQAFCHEVSEIMASSKSLNIPYAMARIRTPANLAPEQVVDRFKLTRGGDLITVLSGDVLVFLSACPESSLLATLRRVAGESFEDDFPNLEFAINEAEVNNLIAQLERSLERGEGRDGLREQLTSA